MHVCMCGLTDPAETVYKMCSVLAPPESLEFIRYREIFYSAVKQLQCILEINIKISLKMRKTQFIPCLLFETKETYLH